MARKRKPKRQEPIPGTERKTIPAIREAAEQYITIRDERAELAAAEVEANDILVGLMVDHEIIEYIDEDAEFRVVIRGTKTRAKVSTLKPSEHEGDV
jgi:hypothetical protein